MAPVYKSTSSTSTTVTPPLEAGYSALTSAGESLFMCSTKEGHTCYHACRGHGSYPLWSDDTFMVDDIDEEDEEEKKKAAGMRYEECDDSSEYDYASDEDWLSDDVNDRAFWEEIQESVARHRARQQQQRIHYSPSDLRFLLTDGESTANTEMGPIVGVITTKPPPEYVWYMVDSDNWMRGSLPERLSEEQDGAYFRYRYHVWDRIPNEDVRDSSSDDDEIDVEEEEDGNDFEVVEEDEEEEEEEEEVTDSAERRSWSDLADLQEEQQQQQS